MSPKPSVGGKICQRGLQVFASQTLTVESAEALTSQVFLRSVTVCRASTLPVCPCRSRWCCRLLVRQTPIDPDGSPAKTYLAVCAMLSALDSGSLIVDTRETAAAGSRVLSGHCAFRSLKVQLTRGRQSSRRRRRSGSRSRHIHVSKP